MKYTRYKRKKPHGGMLSYLFYKTLRRPIRFIKKVYRRPRGKLIVYGSAGALLAVALLLVFVPSSNGAKEGEQRALALSLPDANAGDDVYTLWDETIGATPDLAGEDLGLSEPTPTPDPTLYEGVEDSERVQELQERLMELGYLDIDESTQHFGSATKDAVVRFQRQHELQMDGIAGLGTQEILFGADAKKYTLLEDTTGTDVENFQRQLKDLGYYRSSIDGHYGEKTIEAVKAFQAENGLYADGKAGEKTFDMINSDKAKASPETAKQARSRANILKMIETAEKQIGKKYVLGNVGPNSYDCSGLVYYCMKQAGSNRRRLNAAGYSGVSDWEKITSYSKLEKGDLLFFYNNAKTKVGHVGIYIGGGRMIDASSSNGKVVKRSCTTSYWKSHFVCARRPW